MKNLISLSILMVLFSITIHAQTTVTLQPDSTAGKDAWITSNAPNLNFGNYANFAAIAWSSGGDFISRGLLQFDLTSIPQNAIITSAKLSLYCNTTSDHPQLHSSLSGSNACYLQRITSAWSEFGVNWSNQPSTSTTGQITLAQSTTSTDDYLNIDVKSWAIDMVANPANNFGFMIKLATEAKFRSLIFANSDHIDASKRPKLEITYELPSNDPCITLRPGPAAGKDAWVTSNATSTNYGNYANFAAIAWTSGGEFVSRGLLDFDLSGIPANATITSALLNLYCNTTSDHPQLHSTLSGSNSCFLERITSSWDENTVNWNNQPSTTSNNRVTLPASSSSTQDYLNINVKDLVTDMYNNKNTSFGFMLKLVDEVKFRSLIFANSDHIDSTKWPQLKICYTLPNGVNENATVSKLGVKAYPNPVNRNEILNINSNQQEIITIELFDLTGKMNYSNHLNQSTLEFKLDLNQIPNLNAGNYLLRVVSEDQVQVIKLNIL